MELFDENKIVGLFQIGDNPSGQGASEGGDGGVTWRPANSNELRSLAAFLLKSPNLFGFYKYS
jgi:hypothetical protein